MTGPAAIRLRPPLGAALLSVALGAAAPAYATTDYTRYPSALAADAAEVMARYGGVVIDVDTLFPGESRSLRFIGCGIQKRDADRPVPPEDQQYNFTHCGPAIGADQILPPNTTPPVSTDPPPDDIVIELQRIDTGE